jgi:hypothetical protein
MRAAHWIVLISITGAGCKGASVSSGSDGGPAPSFNNVVDAVVVPMLEQNGLKVVGEDPAVLCRRLAIDLTGLAPTPAEQSAHCAGTPADAADYFMNKATGANVPDGSAPYVWVNRRWWADSFQYQSSTQQSSTFYTYVRELDAVVGDLYSGKIRYDVFAQKALASPAFARRFGIFEANHDLVQIASQAYRVFLGREALPSEAEDFGNLWRGWNTKNMNELTSETTYPDCPVAYDQLMNRIGCRHYELGLDSAECAGANEAACESTILGAGAVVPPQSGFVRWYDLSPDAQAQLAVPGKLIAAQPEFAEAAVDRALAKYLGWWKAGTYRPDFDVPAVRDALTKKFVSDGFDIRKLEREIVTSVLYTQSAALQPNQLSTDPIWAFGPTKLLYAEAWIDTVGQALNKQLGGCDFRYLYSGTATSKINGYYAFPVSTGISKNFYYSTASNMGGCPIATTHADASGLVPAVTRRVALAQLCPGAFKPAAGTALDALVALEFAGVGRAPAQSEVQSLVSHMSVPADGGCDPNNLQSCKTQTLADSLCTSLYATSLFNYY